MLIASNLPPGYWAHAFAYAAYTKNRLPTTKSSTRGPNGSPATPEELWTGKKQDISDLRPFGVECWAYMDNQAKLDPKAARCRFLG